MAAPQTETGWLASFLEKKGWSLANVWRDPDGVRIEHLDMRCLKCGEQTRVDGTRAQGKDWVDPPNVEYVDIMVVMEKHACAAERSAEKLRAAPNDMLLAEVARCCDASQYAHKDALMAELQSRLGRCGPRKVTRVGSGGRMTASRYCLRESGHSGAHRGVSLIQGEPVTLVLTACCEASSIFSWEE